MNFLRPMRHLMPALALTTAFATLPAQAQEWPTQTIRLLVGSPPGAPSDIVARTVAESLGTSLGQPVVVENRPGAGLNLAAGAVASAKPDGHTFLVTSDTVMTVNPLIYSSLSFDARKDLVPVSVLAGFTQMMICNADRGIKTLPELLERAKKDNLTYASGGSGVPGHLAAEMFLAESGVEMTHVPYRGPAPAITDVVGGVVDCGFLTTPQVLPHVKSGRVNALAVSSAKRSGLAPDVPPAAEVGVPNMNATFYQFLMAPAGTPEAILDKMQAAAAKVMHSEDTRKRLANLDVDAMGTTRQEAIDLLAKTGPRWAEIIEKINLKVD